MPESGRHLGAVPYFHARASGGRCSVEHRPPATSGQLGTVPYRTVVGGRCSSEHRPPATSGHLGTVPYRNVQGARCSTEHRPLDRAPPLATSGHPGTVSYRTGAEGQTGGALQSTAPLLHQDTRVRYHTAPEQRGRRAFLYEHHTPATLGHRVRYHTVPYSRGTVPHRAPPPCRYRYRTCLNQGGTWVRYHTSTLEHQGGGALQGTTPLLHQGTWVRYHTVPEQEGGARRSIAPLRVLHQDTRVRYHTVTEQRVRLAVLYRAPCTVPYCTVAGEQCPTEHRPPAATGTVHVSGKKHDYKECTQLQQLEWLDCGNAVPTVAATARSRWC